MQNFHLLCRWLAGFNPIEPNSSLSGIWWGFVEWNREKNLSHPASSSTYLEQVLNVPVVFSRQLLILENVPDGIKPVLSFLECVGGGDVIIMPLLCLPAGQPPPSPGTSLPPAEGLATP